MYNTIFFHQLLQFNFTVLGEIPAINVDTRFGELLFWTPESCSGLETNFKRCLLYMLNYLLLHRVNGLKRWLVVYGWGSRFEPLWVALCFSMFTSNFVHNGFLYCQCCQEYNNRKLSYFNIRTIVTLMCSLACSFCLSVPLTMYTSPSLWINFAPVLVLIKLRLSPPLPMTNPLNALGMSTNSPCGAFSSDFLLCVYARKQDSGLFISLVLPAVNEDYK